MNNFSLIFFYIGLFFFTKDAFGQLGASHNTQPKFEILNPESLQHHSKDSPSFFKKMFQLSWIPIWDSEELENTPCSIDLVQKKLTQGSDDQFKNNFKNVWIDCELLVRKPQSNLLLDSIKMLSINYSLLEHPKAREIIFYLENNIKVRGLLLVNDTKKRDLVVLRPGIYSSFQTMVAERFIVSTLFEEGGMNVLILPSTTGKLFIEDNSEFYFGGYQEGLHTHQILKILQEHDHSLNHQIDKIHLVAMSMGGYGVLTTQLLEKLNPPQNSNRGETLYFCPLLDWSGTQNFHSQFITQTAITQFWNWFRLHDFRKKRQLTNLSFFDQIDELDKEILKVSSQSEQDLENLKKQLKKKHINSLDRSLVLYTSEDTLVPPTINIENQLELFNESVVLKANKGFHCSLPVNYNHAFVSTIILEWLKHNIN